MSISGSTRILGVFGFPVSHSRSPLIQNIALEALGLDWTYVPFLVDPANICAAISAIRALDLVGVNVTVPHKEMIATHLDWVDPVAGRINSINTVVNDSGVLRGYSTDGPGLLWDLQDKNALPEPGEKVLVLGAGGSSRAIVWAFINAGIRVVLSNRTRARAERLVDDLGVSVGVIDWDEALIEAEAYDSKLIVNTTTIGMGHGSPAGIFRTEKLFNTGSVVYDLIYVPSVTPFMNAALSSGGRAINGLGMLVRQAALSLCLWTGCDKSLIPVAAMEKAVVGA